MTDKRIEDLLKSVCDHFDQEDVAVRQRQIRTWRRLKLYWDGFQNTWYSEVAHDWRIYDDEMRAQNNDNGLYDKPVNIFKAYLESIIAALSVSIPSIKCYPDDADNPLDMSTAKAGDRIAELISKHNDVNLLWLHALYIYCTEGLVACYGYPKSDEKYGTYDKQETETETVDAYQCVNCGAQLPDEAFTEHEIDEFMPDDEDVDIHNITGQGEILCPQCGTMIDPALQKSPLVVTRLTGITKEPKTRQCMEIYGGLYVKVPNYARRASECPYLRFSREVHFTEALDRFPDLENKYLDNNSVTSGESPHDPYEAWGRLSTQYNGEYPRNTVTISDYWFRPWAFCVLPKEDAYFLRKKFPDGVKVSKVNDDFAQAENEALDDCWTLTHNPLADHLQHYPLGMLLVSLQDITNDLVSLTEQTIEHGIPQTFADPSVLDFDVYSQTEVVPGGVYPTKALAGKSIGDGFYEVKTATLSAEVLPFIEKTQEFSQLVSGALPSLFGGGASGSKTASEYAMSRAQALQRLQTPWKMLSIWWKQIFAKVIPAYIKTMNEDERTVKQLDNGDFINVFIRKAEVEGRLGSIELESAEQLPVTWAQQKETIMNLLNTNNEFILAALGSPENLPYIIEAIGLPQFKISGEDDRQKQYEEIKLLLASEPIQDGQMDPLTGAPQEQPSVEIDELVDNHQVEADICRDWAISDAGRQAKIDNPNGYKNVLLHMKAHMAIVAASMQQQMMQQAQMQAMAAPPQGAGKANPSKPDKQDNTAPIKDNEDVQTIQ